MSFCTQIVYFIREVGWDIAPKLRGRLMAVLDLAGDDGENDADVPREALANKALSFVILAPSTRRCALEGDRTMYMDDMGLRWSGSWSNAVLRACPSDFAGGSGLVGFGTGVRQDTMLICSIMSFWDRPSLGDCLSLKALPECAAL
eukprot:m.134439 g.134439  ORF g.134439 m.134439 type:complete len:146 (-) comp15822_c0_seq1:2618-3055(-)